MRLFIQWIPELQHYAPGVPVVLVGTKLGKSASIHHHFFIQFNAGYCSFLGIDLVNAVMSRLYWLIFASQLFIAYCLIGEWYIFLFRTW
jgi:uncharacterized membrane protein